MQPRSRLLALSALTVAIATPAQAAITEIFVSAQRRGDEAIQTVPIAVSAFSADQITSLQIDDVKSIGDNVPNLQTYTVTAGAQALQIHARGASVQNPGFNLSESPVGIYLDEAYFGRLASANLDLADIERIEVLRGPQGTLYGRNTIAGAVKVITRTPGDDAWAHATLGLGNYQTLKFSGSAGGPIEEGALAGSLSFLYEDRNEGWQNNPVTGASPGEYENKVARAKLHWYGTQGIDAVLGAWVADIENDGYNGIPYVPFDNTGSPNPDFDPAPAGSAPLGDFYDNFSAEGVNYGRSDQAGVNLTLGFDIGSLTLRSITAYADIEDEFGFDLAGGGAGPFGLLIASDSQMDQFSQEFQLIGNAFDDRLAWQLGLFYMNEDGEQRFSGTIPGLSAVPSFDERIRNETDSYAVFAEGTYDVSARWSLTAGLRWTKDEKEYSDDCAGAFCTAASVALEDDWDEVTGKLGVNYQLSDRQLLYLTAAQGFQSGGFRTLCFGNLGPDCGGTAFDPQTVDSFELGYKGDLFDNTLRINAAAFYALYDDIQQVVLRSGPFSDSFPIDNIGEVDVYGLEIEVTWSPVDNINIFGMLGVQESDFGSVNPASPPGGFEGNAPPTDELSSNPGWQGRVGFNYAVDLANGITFSYGLDLNHVDDFFSESRNLVKIDSYTRLNGFAGISGDDGRWAITLTGKNITDEEDNVSGIFANGFANVRTVLPPAEYMLNFKISY